MNEFYLLDHQISRDIGKTETKIRFKEVLFELMMQYILASLFEIHLSWARIEDTITSFIKLN